MSTPTDTETIPRLERFLDDLHTVRDPGSLEEPFRSLWYRVHGYEPDNPQSMSRFEREIGVSGGVGSSMETMEGVEFIPSDTDIGDTATARKGRIEVISPKEVGPTLDMTIPEEKRVTFKAAGEKEIMRARTKEDAARKMVELQKKAAPIKGMGGEAGLLFDSIREVALKYREGEYDEAAEKAQSLIERIDDTSFRKDLMVYLKDKISDYGKAGADLTDAISKFRDMAEALKEGSGEFLALAGSVNKMAEDAIKGIVTDSVTAEVVQVKEGEEEPDKEEEKGVPEPSAGVEGPPQAPTRKVKITKKLKVEKERRSVGKEEKGEQTDTQAPPAGKRTPEAESKEPHSAVEPSEMEREDEDGERTEDPREDEKKVLKTQIVKKKLVKLVPTEPQPSREGKGTQPPDEQASPEGSEQMGMGGEEETAEEAVKEPGLQGNESLTGEVAEQDPPAEENERGGGEGQDREAPPEQKEGVPPEKVKKAFDKLQFTYKVALKMHEAGRDVSQIFDLLNYAETVRDKGDMRAYTGIADQCESMIIKLQGQ